jgi:archaemetzincin
MKHFSKFLFYIFIVTYSSNLSAQKNVNVLPLGNVNLDVIKVIEAAVNEFYGYKSVILSKAPLTSDILANSKTRYEASKILAKFNSNNNLLIITDKDIACKKGSINEWGIFGLGYRPGTTCVVSTFRIMKNVSKKTFHERLKKICLHEIGHNLGLNHCSSDDVRCMMNDAKGTIREVDQEKIFFCKKCWSVLRKS